jgi:hypothetical protein
LVHTENEQRWKTAFNSRWRLGGLRIRSLNLKNSLRNIRMETIFRN